MLAAMASTETRRASARIGMPCPVQFPSHADGDEEPTILHDICSTPEALRSVLGAYVDGSKVAFPSLSSEFPAGHAFAGRTALEVMAGCRQREDGAFANRFVIVGSGSSLNVAFVAEYLIEQIARIPVEVHYASEYRHRKPIFRAGDVLVLVTASGETEDVLRCIDTARSARLGAEILTLAVVNEANSTAMRESDAHLEVMGGEEVGTTSTKVFSASALTFALLAIALAEAVGALDADAQAKLLAQAKELPELVQRVITKELEADRNQLWDVACLNVLAQNFIFLGRGFNYPVAMEGAMKCKEIAYIHAEGYPAAEMKHGPIALIDQFMPVVIICPPSDPCYLKIVSNLQEVKTRGGCVIAVTEEGNEEIEKQCETVLFVPRTHEYFTPIVNVIPMQLLAYMMGVLRGNNVTAPRALRKTVSAHGRASSKG